MPEPDGDLEGSLRSYANDWRRQVGAPTPVSIARLLATRGVVAPARRHRAWVLAAAALAASAGVALVVLIPRHRPAAAEPATPATQRVSALVGLWAVTAGGEPSSTRLQVDADSLRVWRACGDVSGHWRASPEGGFVASFNAFSGPCSTAQTQAAAAQTLSSLPWISNARGFRITATGWEALSRDGTVLATFRPGTRPTVPPTVASSEADPPVLSASQRADIDGPRAPFPTGLRPATTVALVGTWLPAKGGPGSVTFNRDGTYKGSDGCNGYGGQWISGPGGSLVVTASGSTMIGCAGTNVPFEASSATRAAFDGDTLVLVASDGHVIDRLVHGGTP